MPRNSFMVLCRKRFPHTTNLFKHSGLWKSTMSKRFTSQRSTNFNPLQPGVAYLYPLKTLANLKVVIGSKLICKAKRWFCMTKLTQNFRKPKDIQKTWKLLWNLNYVSNYVSNSIKDECILKFEANWRIILQTIVETFPTSKKLNLESERRYSVTTSCQNRYTFE